MTHPINTMLRSLASVQRGEFETVELVCSNKPRPSVQSGRKFGNQWWKREAFHVAGADGKTLCGVPTADWLKVEKRTAKAAREDEDCCQKCAAVLNVR